MIIATEINKSKLPDFSIERRCSGTVAGIDEAGRGPLAGPVVAACIILDVKNYPKHLNDSKKLSEKKRAQIFIELQNSAQFGIGIIDEKIIDKVNILNATKLAMKEAFENLCKKHDIKPNMVIVDGNFVPQIDCLAQSIIKGDTKSLSIAAASIIAKETRDQIMIKLDKEFPHYDWKKNKGYPTKLHFDRIAEFGISKYHRQSFTLKKNDRH
jgi:ribonuclease HII